MKSVYSLILLFILAACSQTQNSGSEFNETETKKVLDHHWEAFKANDLEETMADYTDESVLITPTATYRGLQEIRTNFINAFKAFPSDSATFILENSIVVKDVGYILWNCKAPAVNLTFGTDTFIIRDGKIARQTFAGVFQ